MIRIPILVSESLPILLLFLLIASSQSFPSSSSSSSSSLRPSLLPSVNAFFPASSFGTTKRINHTFVLTKVTTITTSNRYTTFSSIQRSPTTHCFSPSSQQDSSNPNNNNNNNHQNNNSKSKNNKMKHLVLVGGGHAHIQVIKALHRRARPSNLRITLIDVQENASYSGMVPGCVSKLYSPAQTMIQLKPLAEWSEMEFVVGRVVDLDLDRKKVVVVLLEDCAGDENRRKEVEFDVISLDIGSTSRGWKDLVIHHAEDADGVDIVNDCRVIPTRPISDLVTKIDTAEIQLLQKRQSKEQQEDVKVVVVGGGAAGIELAMAIRARWDPLFSSPSNDDGNPSSSSSSSCTGPQFTVTILDSGQQLLPTETHRCQTALTQLLHDRNITVQHNTSVKAITPHTLQLTPSRSIRTTHAPHDPDHLDDDSSEIPYTHCLWATGAAPHELAHTLRERGLDVNDRGWIRVSSTLQSLSHPFLFAAGDCCSLVRGGGDGDETRPPPPKAGVYAVRSGPILIENLIRFASSLDTNRSVGTNTTTTEGLRLIEYQPQDDFLKLLMCGDGTALGFRFGLPLYGKWVWQLKDRIDRMFMDLFDESNLPDLSTTDDDGDGEGHCLDTSQYDAVVHRPDPPLCPEEAGTLLMRTDDGVNYERAWNVLRDMMANDEYRNQVLEFVNDGVGSKV